jgi:purine-nucleoside phosphorylase
VLAVSCVTNMAAGLGERKLSHEEVLETGAAVGETLVKFLRMVLPRLDQGEV